MSSSNRFRLDVKQASLQNLFDSEFPRNYNYFLLAVRDDILVDESDQTPVFIRACYCDGAVGEKCFIESTWWPVRTVYTCEQLPRRLIISFKCSPLRKPKTTLRGLELIDKRGNCYTLTRNNGVYFNPYDPAENMESQVHVVGPKEPPPKIAVNKPPVIRTVNVDSGKLGDGFDDLPYVTGGDDWRDKQTNMFLARIINARRSDMSDQSNIAESVPNDNVVVSEENTLAGVTVTVTKNLITKKPTDRIAIPSQEMLIYMSDKSVKHAMLPVWFDRNHWEHFNKKGKFEFGRCFFPKGLSVMKGLMQTVHDMVILWMGQKPVCKKIHETELLNTFPTKHMAPMFHIPPFLHNKIMELTWESVNNRAGPVDHVVHTNHGFDMFNFLIMVVENAFQGLSQAETVLEKEMVDVNSNCVLGTIKNGHPKWKTDLFAAHNFMGVALKYGMTGRDPFAGRSVYLDRLQRNCYGVVVYVVWNCETGQYAVYGVTKLDREGDVIAKYGVMKDPEFTAKVQANLQKLNETANMWTPPEEHVGDDVKAEKYIQLSDMVTEVLHTVPIVVYVSAQLQRYILHPLLTAHNCIYSSVADSVDVVDLEMTQLLSTIIDTYIGV